MKLRTSHRYTPLVLAVLLSLVTLSNNFGAEAQTRGKSKPDTSTSATNSSNIAASRQLPSSLRDYLADSFAPCKHLNEDGSVPYREGKISGLSYYYSRDCSFGMSIGPDLLDEQLWSGGCKRDPIVNKLDCQMQKGEVFVRCGDGSQPTEVNVTYHNFPGRNGALRVDAHPALTTKEDGSVAASRFWTKMLKGDEIVARGYNWPYDCARDETTPLNATRDAHALIQWLHAYQNYLADLIRDPRGCYKVKHGRRG